MLYCRLNEGYLHDIGLWHLYSFIGNDNIVGYIGVVTVDVVSLYTEIPVYHDMYLTNGLNIQNRVPQGKLC